MLRPMNNMMSVPFIGKLNTVFIVAIGFGMCLILLCMVFNILNAWKAGDVEHIWFDTNSVAGLVFYGSAVVSIALILNGKTLPGGIVLFIMFGVPLILIFLKEPLTALIEKKSEVMPKEKGMFVVQGLFEMFEVLLSYFSNTFPSSHRSFRSQPCSDDGSRSHACRRRKRKPELDSSSSGKPFCMWYGGPDRRYPGASSGIL